MSNGDPVQVNGPDGKHYSFPAGTTKEKAIAYFRAKGIGLPKLQAAKPPSSPLTSTNGGYLTSPGGVGRKIEVGAGLGAEKAFGFKPPIEGDPQSLTYKDVAKQLVSNLGGSAIQSLKLWGPLAPIDMIAKGIEGIASGTEEGTKIAYKGAKERNLQKFVEGTTEAIGSVGQAFAGGEGEGALEKLPKPKVPTVDNIRTALNRAKMTDLLSDNIHARGIRIKSMFRDATKRVQDNIARHADLVNKVVPKDAIDATQIKANADTAIADVVKTPEKYPPVLQQIAQSIKNHPPGKWDFETAKQFRTNLYAAMERSSGPMKAALTQTYGQLTSEMAKAAENAGARFSYSLYDSETRKYYQQFGDLVNKINDSATGHEVASHLLKDPALTKETIQSLLKYGLPTKDVSKFVADSDRALEFSRTSARGIFGYIYGRGSKAGAITYLGARTAGMPWMESLGPAVAAGMTAVFLKNLKTVMDIDPKLAEDFRSRREMAGPQPVPSVQTPPSATPTPPGAPPTGPTPSAASSPVSRVKPLTDVERAAMRRDYTARNAAATAVSNESDQIQALRTDNLRLENELRSNKGSAEERSSAEQRLSQNRAMITELESKATTPGPGANASTTAEPSVTPPSTSIEIQKIPEGEVGREPGAQLGTTRRSRIGTRTKDAERKAAQRAVATPQAGPKIGKRAGALTDAEGGVSLPQRTIEDISTTEIEQDLQSVGKDGKLIYSALQKTRKFEKWDDDEYRGVLIDAYVNYLRRKMEKNAAD